MLENYLKGKWIKLKSNKTKRHWRSNNKEDPKFSTGPGLEAVSISFIAN